MLKTLLAGTAMASLAAFGAQAQETPVEGETTPPMVMEHQLPSATSEEPAADIDPETSADGGPATGEAAPVVPETTADTGAEPAPEVMAEDSGAGPVLEEGWSTVDAATISADTLIGKDIRTYEQETVAAVDDVLLTPDGQVESVVARFGGFLGFGETTVLLTMDEIDVVRDADENVFVLTDLTPEAIKDRPEYTDPEG